MRQMILFLGALLLAPLADLAAQETPSLAPGARVRVTTSTLNRITWSQNEMIKEGTLVTLYADTLMLRAKGKSAPLAIPLAHVTRLDVSRGGASRLESVSKGALIGLFACGALAALFVYKLTEGQGIFYGFLMGSVPGAAIGGGIGALMPGERWERVPLERIRVSLSPQRHGGVRLAASFAF